MSRHDFDPLSLVAGLLFAAVGAGLLGDWADVIDLRLGWIVAVVLFALGLAGLLGTRPSTAPEAAGDASESDDPSDLDQSLDSM